MGTATGCEPTPYDYALIQPRDNIVSVEICDFSDEKTKDVLFVFDETNRDTFLDEVFALPYLHQPVFDYPQVYGDVVIFITYTDGTVQVIGAICLGRIEPDGRRVYHLASYPEANAYFTLLEKYVDPELLKIDAEYRRTRDGSLP